MWFDEFYSKCYDPYLKRCAFAMRSRPTKYGSIILIARTPKSFAR